MIREFIAENFMYGQAPEELGNDTSFLDSGIIDSTGVMELIQFLEDEFEISVNDDEMVPENLDSVDRLCQYLEHKGVSQSDNVA